MSSLDKLVGGVTVIKVGAATESELKEKKGSSEHALLATRAALDEGVVIGGGVALIRAQRALDRLTMRPEEELGVTIIRHAVEEPLRQLVINAGKEGATIVQTVKDSAGNFGFDVVNGQYTDLVAEGVIDAAKVVRSALQIAASVAGRMLTTVGLVTENPEREGVAVLASQSDEAGDV